MKSESGKLCMQAESGLTLMELVVAMAIMGILIVVSYGVIAMNAATFNVVETSTVQRWDVRKAMQMLRHECQMIDRQKFGPIGHHGKKSNRLVFTTLDGDRIVYRRNSSSILQRKANSGAWTNLVDELTVKPFRFLDVNLNPTSTLNDVAFVEVELSRTEAGQTFTLLERFYVRN